MVSARSADKGMFSDGVSVIQLQGVHTENRWSWSSHKTFIIPVSLFLYNQRLVDINC